MRQDENLNANSTHGAINLASVHAMSLGASLSDIINILTFCKALYRKCEDAAGEYDEISNEARGQSILEVRPSFILGSNS